MQTDMHYYGTYAMARAAGISEAAAKTIATAAEYVDDASGTKEVTLLDGGYIEADATAHHTLDAQNVEVKDQRKVWIPFHFLPGNSGSSVAERLVCEKNSPNAQQMVIHHLAAADKTFGLELIGITAHVYADTFSHYGFSGISSAVNRVDKGSIQLSVQDAAIDRYIKDKAEDFFFKYGGGEAADLLGLGHGAVATYPDRPYLRWNFTYEDGRLSGKRDNQATFLEACQQLHAIFSRFAEQRPEIQDATAYRDFATIKAAVTNVLAVEADMDGRIKSWQQAVVAGGIFGNDSGEPIPAYDTTGYDQEIASFMAGCTSSDAIGTTVYRFQQAAAFHRAYVLSDLLPRCGLAIT